MQNNIKNNKVLIVGNGQSSVNPNASKLSKDRDIFRVNKFFLEPYKNFGKNIKLLKFVGEPFCLFLIDHIIKKGIYNIEIAAHGSMKHKKFFSIKSAKKYTTWEYIEKKYKLRDKVKQFDGVNRLNSTKKHDKITSGVYLINCAIQMGYNDITIVGIDFYSEKSLSKYPIIIPKCIKNAILPEGQYISKKIKNKNKSSYDTDLHSYNTDALYIQNILEQYPNVTIQVYVDEENPYENWNKILKNFKNIKINKLPKETLDDRPLISHCIDDLNEIYLNYKKKYFWKIIRMKMLHYWQYKKDFIKKIIFSIMGK